MNAKQQTFIEVTGTLLATIFRLAKDYDVAAWEVVNRAMQELSNSQDHTE